MVSLKASLNPQHIRLWYGCTTTAEDHILLAKNKNLRLDYGQVHQYWTEVKVFFFFCTIASECCLKIKNIQSSQYGTNYHTMVKVNQITFPWLWCSMWTLTETPYLHDLMLLPRDWLSRSLMGLQMAIIKWLLIVCLQPVMYLFLVFLPA